MKEKTTQKLQGTDAAAIRRRKPVNSNKIQLISLVIVPLLLVFVFSYLPMVGIIIAFKDFRYNEGMFGSEWTGFENFKLLVGSNDFWRITKNTVIMNFGFIGLGMLAAVALAILFYEVKSRKAIKVYQTLSIFPHFLSWVVVGYIAYAFLQPSMGMVNQLIRMFGGEGTMDWYSADAAAMWPAILIFVSIWKHVGMDCIIYYATMMGIDSELYEAASLDGANKWKQVIHITIPQLIPIIVILAIMKVGNIFRADFGLFWNLTRQVGELQDTTDVLDTYIYRLMQNPGGNAFARSTAMSLLQSVVGFVMVMITNSITKKVDDSLALF